MHVESEIVKSGMKSALFVMLMKRIKCFQSKVV